MFHCRSCERIGLRAHGFTAPMNPPRRMLPMPRYLEGPQSPVGAFMSRIRLPCYDRTNRERTMGPRVKHTGNEAIRWPSRRHSVDNFEAVLAHAMKLRPIKPKSLIMTIFGDSVVPRAE